MDSNGNIMIKLLAIALLASDSFAYVFRGSNMLGSGSGDVNIIAAIVLITVFGIHPIYQLIVDKDEGEFDLFTFILKVFVFAPVAAMLIIATLPLVISMRIYDWFKGNE